MSWIMQVLPAAFKKSIWPQRPSRALRARPRKARPAARLRPSLENLETRTVPTILFQPQFGAEVRVTENDYGMPYFNGPTLSSTPVHLIFEGSYWNAPTGITKQNVIDQTRAVLNSSYLSGLTQYGSNGSATLVGWTTDTTMPVIPKLLEQGFVFYNEDLQATAAQFMGVEFYKQPSARGLYLVVTPPGSTSLSSPDAAGYHSETWQSIGSTYQYVPFGWTGIKGTTVADQKDSFSRILSHEVAEAMSDPYTGSNRGVTVYRGASWVDDRWYDEIADFEPDGQYTYRLATGAVVQAYWSVRDNVFLVPDGTSQLFTLKPNLSDAGAFDGTYNLTVNGDQAWYKNDQIAIDTIANPAGDQVRVNLNGEVVTFDPNRIANITINSGTGNDTINVERLPYGVALTVNTGTGVDTVNLSPAAGQMDNLRNTVTVHGGGNTTLTLGDSGTVSHTVGYTIAEGSLTRSYRGTSGHLHSSSIAFDGLSQLAVSGAASGSTFQVRTDGLTTPVRVTGHAGFDSLVFDDALNANNVATTYTIGGDRITRVGTDLSPIIFGMPFVNLTTTVQFDYVEDVTVNGGSSGNQFAVQDLPYVSHLTLYTGTGVNTVQVGNDSGTLDSTGTGILIEGQGTDTVILNDRGVANFGNSDLQTTYQVAFTITDFSVRRDKTTTSVFTDAFGQVRSTYTNTTTIAFFGVENLTLLAGATNNTFDVQSTQGGTDLAIYAGAGDDTITVGDGDNNLSGLAGPLHVFGEGGTNHLIVDDRGTENFRFPPDSTSFTLADSAITYTTQPGNTSTLIGYSDIADLAIFGRNGPVAFVVQSTPTTATTLQGGAGVNTLDYSTYLGDVLVDLPLGTATDLAAIGNIQNVIGGLGNNVLVGDGNANVLTGGAGRNLIVGGTGDDVIQGGADDNILIPGTTTYDADTAALLTIMQEWTRADLSFAERVGELSSNAFAFPLTVDTVFADLGNDTLIAGPGQNWFAPAAATTTSLQLSTAAAGFGEAVVLTATVGSAGPGTPSGIVTFFDNGIAIGTATLDGAGQASLTTTGLSVGDHALTTAYAGEGLFQGSTSQSMNLTVTPAATQTTLGTSAVKASLGQTVTFTAAVSTITPGLATPTGIVMFLDGNAVLGSAALANGLASFQTSALALGSHSIHAVFASADANLANSASAALTQQVLKASNTTLSTSLATSIFGQAITLTARVSAALAGSGTPMGTVTFLDGGVLLGSVSLVSGSATLTTSALAVGSHAITVVYGGNSAFGASTSSVLSQVIQKASTKTTLTGPAAAVAFGQSVTLTAKVTVVAPGAGTPSGTVTFKDGATVLGTGTLINGVATFQTRLLSKGSHTITAVFGGDADDLTSTSASVVVTIR